MYVFLLMTCLLTCKYSNTSKFRGTEEELAEEGEDDELVKEGSSFLIAVFNLILLPVSEASTISRKENGKQYASNCGRV